MSRFYQWLGVSRQAHQKAQKSAEMQKGIMSRICDFIQSQRVVHPGVGLKKLYHQMPNKEVGRDKFIDYAISAGLGQKRKRKHIKTTFSVYTIYKNILAGKTLTGINQGWSGDITYVKIGQKHGYVFLLMDIYSRRILGYVASDSLMATVNVSCLNMAINNRKGYSFTGIIHHSDRGSQYIAGDYLLTLQDAKFQISMCNSALDNPYSERINGILKLEYLDFHQFDNLSELQKVLKIAVEHYNNIRPHLNLKMMSPVKFEKYLETIELQNRTKMTIPLEH